MNRANDPAVPEDVTPRELDGGARAELKTLNKENADAVAGHLVMAARLIGDDPALAHLHALAAQRRAGRVPVVRETVAISAYSVGDFALALRELRTYRRMSGSVEHIALEVDSERGLGRPERGLELGRSVDRSSLSAAAAVALAIAMSGARLDLGDAGRALDELRAVDARPDTAFAWSADLFYAYAEVLAELGREDEAAVWRDRAALAESAWTERFAGEETIEVIEDVASGLAGDVAAVTSAAETERSDSDEVVGGDEENDGLARA